MKFNHLKLNKVKEDSFIGIKIHKDEICLNYPESYHLDESDVDRNDILDLLATLSLTKSPSKESDSVDYSIQDKSNYSAFLSYIWIIKDFMKNGFYIEPNRFFKEKFCGKINWKKTIQREKPCISEGNVIYPNVISEVKIISDSVIAEAYRYCVKKSCILIGWLYGLSPDNIEMYDSVENKIPYYLNAISIEMNKTFDDNKQKRFTHMKNVLIGLGEIINKDNSVVYGVNKYHYVFERMIDHIFGTVSVDDYNPKFEWHLVTSGEEILEGPTIRPDTIMRLDNDNDIYIIDSKYYRYGSLNLSQTKGLPESSSIVKQMAYGSYISSKYCKNSPLCKVYNIFILPFDSHAEKNKRIVSSNKNIEYIGYVCSKSKEDNAASYEKIYTFLIDLKYVIKTWNSLGHDEDQMFLVDMVQDNLTN